MFSLIDLSQIDMRRWLQYGWQLTIVLKYTEGSHSLSVRYRRNCTVKWHQPALRYISLVTLYGEAVLAGGRQLYDFVDIVDVKCSVTREGPVGQWCRKWTLKSVGTIRMSHECNGFSHHRQLDCFLLAFLASQPRKYSIFAIPRTKGPAMTEVILIWGHHYEPSHPG